MKTLKFLAVTVALMLSCQLLWAKDVNLFDYNGEAVAYIDLDDDDLTIYLWDGTPVAYLVPDDDAYNIFGFNGKHLGWYENGIVKNHDGYAVGFKEGAVNIYVKYRPNKSPKKVKPYKAFKQLVPFKTFYKFQFFDEPLTGFLLEGRK